MLTVSITALGDKGDGTGILPDGTSVYVPYTAPGDTVHAEPYKHSAQGTFALPRTILTSSPSRTDAPCTYYTQCGGCALQHLNASAYRKFKEDKFTRALLSAGFPPEDTEISYIAIAHNARRRAELHIRGGKAGFFRTGSNDLVPIERCLVLTPELNACLVRLQVFLAKEPLNVASVELTHADTAIDALLHLKTPLDASLLQLLPEMAQSVGLGRICQHYKGEYSTALELNPVYIHCADIPVPLPPGGFVQATRQAQDTISHEVVQALQHCTHVADLFSGIGTYTFALSRYCRVHAFEGIAAMTHAVEQAAKRHMLRDKISASTRNLMKQPLHPEELKAFDGAVINPPRAGALAQTKVLAERGIPRIVMVSCNPATFSRDAAVLKEKGYRLEKATAIDQFVWSPHLEMLAVFSL